MRRIATLKCFSIRKKKKKKENLEEKIKIAPDWLMHTDQGVFRALVNSKVIRSSLNARL